LGGRGFSELDTSLGSLSITPSSNAKSSHAKMSAQILHHHHPTSSLKVG
jgi:hypothetical protein